MDKPTVARVRLADENHQVVTVVGGDFRFCKKPCPQCPWTQDVPPGDFPAEAFRHSAETAYDMAEHTFACHMAGSERPATCAGFLLRGADHNLSIRLRIVRGQFDPSQVYDDGRPLYRCYKDMAVANGVAPDDPALTKCRPPQRLDDTILP